MRHLVLELAAAKNSTERIQFRRVLLQLNRQMVKLENEKSDVLSCIYTPVQLAHTFYMYAYDEHSLYTPKTV